MQITARQFINKKKIKYWELCVELMDGNLMTFAYKNSSSPNSYTILLWLLNSFCRVMHEPQKYSTDFIDNFIDEYIHWLAIFLDQFHMHIHSVFFVLRSSRKKRGRALVLLPSSETLKFFRPLRDNLRLRRRLRFCGEKPKCLSVNRRGKLAKRLAEKPLAHLNRSSFWGRKKNLFFRATHMKNIMISVKSSTPSLLAEFLYFYWAVGERVWTKINFQGLFKA